MYKGLDAALNNAMARFGPLYPLGECANICECAAIGCGDHTDRQRIFFEKLGSELRQLNVRMQEFQWSVEQMSEAAVKELIEERCDPDITTALWLAEGMAQPKDEPDQDDAGEAWKAADDGC